VTGDTFIVGDFVLTTGRGPAGCHWAVRHCGMNPRDWVARGGPTDRMSEAIEQGRAALRRLAEAILQSLEAV